MPGRSRALIREARRRAGLSQAELARRAGVSQPVISAYESGRREPGLSMLTKLVEATGHELQVDLVAQPGLTPGLPDTPTGRSLRRHRRAIIESAEQRGATNVRLFGSVARGDDTESSDVDLLVDLADDVGIVGLIGLEREIAEVLGREVDVVPAANLKTGLASQVLAEAIPLWGAIGSGSTTCWRGSQRSSRRSSACGTPLTTPTDKSASSDRSVANLHAAGMHRARRDLRLHMTVVAAHRAIY